MVSTVAGNLRRTQRIDSVRGVEFDPQSRSVRELESNHLLGGEMAAVDFPIGYGVMLEAMRQRAVDVPGVVEDIRECLRREIEVSPAQTLASIDYLIEVNAQLRDSIYGLRSALDSTMGVDDSEAWLLLTLDSKGKVATKGNVKIDKWALALREIVAQIDFRSST